MQTSPSSALVAARALRWRQWLHFLALPAASVTPAALHRSLAPLGLATVAAAGALAWAYGLNAVTDRATDPSHKNPLAGAPSISRMTWAFLVVAVAAAFTAAAALGPAATVAVGLSLAAGAVYSTGPRAKAWPFVGVVTNAIIFVPLCSLLTDVTRTRPALPLLLSCFATLLVQNQLVHELADAEEDRRRGDRTTAIVLGVGGTRLAIAVVSATGAALAWWVCPDWGSLTQATVLVAAATVVAVCGDAARSRRRHRWLSLAGGAALWLCAP